MHQTAAVVNRCDILRAPFLLSALLFALVCAGCNAPPAGPETAPTTGTVTFNGDPVAEAIITFQPLTAGQGQTCQFATDENGKFVARTGDPGGESKEGAVPGEYRVSVIKQELTPGQMDPKNLLPPKYMSARTSGLEVTVAAGVDNEFELQLKD